MSEYFPEPKSLEQRVKFELDLSNYATKADLENTTAVDTSKSAKKIDLASLRSNVNKLYIGKLKNVPNNLRNLKSKIDKLDLDELVPAPLDVEKNDVVKKDIYNANIKNIEDKIPGITKLATNTTLSSKINEGKRNI